MLNNIKWYGKHIRLFEEILKEKNSTIFDFKKVFLETKDYLTLEEIVYFLSINYFNQIEPKIYEKSKCQRCYENINVEFTEKDFYFIQGNLEEKILSLKSGEIILELQKPKYVENLEKTLEGIIIEKENRKINKDNLLNSFFYNEFIYSIKEVIRNGESIPVSTLTIEEILLEEIELKEYENVIKEFQSLKSSLKIEKRNECDCCGEISIITLDSKKIPKEIEKYFLV